MNSFHRVENISFSDNSISLIIDGKMHTFKLKDISMKLLNAPNDKRLLFDISPSGYGFIGHCSMKISPLTASWY